MLKILICTTKSDRFMQLKAIVQELYPSEVILAKCKEEVTKSIMLHSIDTVLIDLPFISDQHEIAYVLKLLNRYPDLNILLLLASKYVYSVRERVEKYGVFVLSKPVQKEILAQLLSFLRANSFRFQNYQKEQKKLKNKIAEIKLVDLAKCLLMENEFLTEAKAHRYIEKTAMDERKTRKQIATEIIRRYQSI